MEKRQAPHKATTKPGVAKKPAAKKPAAKKPAASKKAVKQKAKAGDRVGRVFALARSMRMAAASVATLTGAASSAASGPRPARLASLMTSTVV